MKKIFAKEEHCMGCRLCEIYCLTAHSKSKKIIKAYKEEFPRAMPRIVVEQKGPLSFALQCRHCEDAPCVEACLTGAMQKDPVSGAVTHNDKKCVGCWMCVMSCPFGVIKRDMSGKKIATKCDLCADVGEPVCVANCPNGALIYADEDKKI